MISRQPPRFFPDKALIIPFGFYYLIKGLESKQEISEIRFSGESDLVTPDFSDPWEFCLKLARDGFATLASAESCTGGMLGAALTGVPGASTVYRGGVVAYDNSVKIDLLAVNAALIESFGAVSREVGGAMASGARLRLGADLAVSITGIAGPGGGSPEKPVGTVWFGVSDPITTTTHHYLFVGDRDAVRQQATETACCLIIERLLLSGEPSFQPES